MHRTETLKRWKIAKFICPVVVYIERTYIPFVAMKTYEHSNLYPISFCNWFLLEKVCQKEREMRWKENCLLHTYMTWLFLLIIHLILWGFFIPLCTNACECFYRKTMWKVFHLTFDDTSMFYEYFRAANLINRNEFRDFWCGNREER